MKRLAASALATVVTLGSSLALAGSVVSSSVYVSTGGRNAGGALGTARNSADAYQMIGCTYTRWAEGSDEIICNARDASYVSASCIVWYPTQSLRDTVAMIHGDSYLYFSWDASGTCAVIQVSDRSDYEPKR